MGWQVWDHRMAERQALDAAAQGQVAERQGQQGWQGGIGVAAAPRRASHGSGGLQRQTARRPCACFQSAVFPHLRFFRMRRIWGRLRTQLPAMTSHPITTATAAASEGLAAVTAGAATAAAAAAATTVCRGRRAASVGMQRALRLAGAAAARPQVLGLSAAARERRRGARPPPAVS